MSQKSFDQITLRGIPRDYLKELKREARQKSLSLNQVLLEHLLPPRQKSADGHCAELLDLAGTWDKKRTRDFMKKLKEIRKIDWEMWR